MTWRLLVVYGASGHGKVVADILRRAGAPNLAGFIDDRAEMAGHSVLGLPVLGPWADLEAEILGGGVGVALGIGDNRTRQGVAERCQAAGATLVTAIHPTATIADSCAVGEGTVVMAGAVINPDARVGRGVIVNTGAVVEHDVLIGDYAHFSPNAATGGAAQLGALSHLGLGAVILPGVCVGSETIVGAGAVVNRDLPDGVVAIGVPAQIHRRL